MSNQFINFKKRNSLSNDSKQCLAGDYNKWSFLLKRFFSKFYWSYWRVVIFFYLKRINIVLVKEQYSSFYDYLFKVIISSVCLWQNSSKVESIYRKKCWESLVGEFQWRILSVPRHWNENAIHSISMSRLLDAILATGTLGHIDTRANLSQIQISIFNSNRSLKNITIEDSNFYFI